MKTITVLNFLLGVLLTGSTVVAGDASLIATRNKVITNPRHASAIPLHASATDAASATTSNFNLTSIRPVADALAPLPPGVSELKVHDFFRQPIGPRGVEPTPKLRSLDGRRTQIPACEILQPTSVQEDIAGTNASAGYGR